MDLDLAALVIATLGWIVGVAGYWWNRQQNRRLQTKELRTLRDWFKGGRTFLNPPERTGGVAWNRAYGRIREARRRTGEVLGHFPLKHQARTPLEELRDACLVFADIWDEFGECADTKGGQDILMKGLKTLQETTKGAMLKIENELERAGG